uniref:Uncharacterized protein n=1 Tax=viral metagenome TaxID=1070528 RepID=A0A6C0KNZ0_9ZZZZ
MRLNVHYIQETLESILSQIGYFYQPTKANKKKIIDFFQTFPYFFFDIHFQNVLYKIIQNHPIRSFYDSNNHMQDYCYLIYKDFMLTHETTYKSQEEFYAHLKYVLENETHMYKKWKQKNIHNYLFFFMIVFLIILYYFINK